MIKPVHKTRDFDFWNMLNQGRQNWETVLLYALKHIQNFAKPQKNLLKNEEKSCSGLIISISKLAACERWYFETSDIKRLTN